MYTNQIKKQEKSEKSPTIKAFLKEQEFINAPFEASSSFIETFPLVKKHHLKENDIRFIHTYIKRFRFIRVPDFSIAQMAKFTNLTYAQVRGCVDKLKRLGILRVHVRWNKNSLYKMNLYCLSEFVKKTIAASFGLILLVTTHAVNPTVFNSYRNQRSLRNIVIYNNNINISELAVRNSFLKKEESMNIQEIAKLYKLSESQQQEAAGMSQQAIATTLAKMEKKKDAGLVFGSGASLFMKILVEEDGRTKEYGRTPKQSVTNRSASVAVVPRNKENDVQRWVSDYTLQEIAKQRDSARKQVENAQNTRYFSDKDRDIRSYRFEMLQEAYIRKLKQEGSAIEQSKQT